MRRVGLAAFEASDEHYERVGEEFSAANTDIVNSQISRLQEHLSHFAHEHGHQIRTQPQFRTEFAQMCASIGVDLLSYSSSNGTGSMWSRIMGKDVNDFYFGLAVRIIEKCRASRDKNGGVITLAQLRSLLSDNDESASPTEDDIVRAVKSLEALGPGMDITRLPNNVLVIRSVPVEFSSDHGDVLMACEALGYVTVSMLSDNFNWTVDRAQWTLDEMVTAGLLWIDGQATPIHYWSPAGIF